MKKIISIILIIVAILFLKKYIEVKQLSEKELPVKEVQKEEEKESITIPYVPLDERENSVIFEYDGDDISSLKGDKIFVAFWSSYCKYCKDEFEALKKVQEKTKDVTFVLISHDENVEELEEYLEENKGNFFFIHNPSKSIRSKLNDEDKYIPSLYLLDSEHNIIRHTNKILNEDKILEFIVKK